MIHRDSYHDSVLLMRLTQELKVNDAVRDAVVVMGTPHNLDLLRQNGFSGPELESAGANDLVIAVRGKVTPELVETVLEELLRGDRSGTTFEMRPGSLAEAVRDHPEANLVLISVPGERAAREARQALAAHRHVMLFSDNVSIAEEIELKNEARRQGLLMMGPDCGTAIINGHPLAFANAVRRGPIGVVGASGTGIQEITSCIHRLGSGVSQAIGTGGRDLSDAVGGTMTLFGIEALAADPATEVIVVVSKPPSQNSALKIVAALASTPKPCIVHFVGADPRPAEERHQIVFADTLAGTAELACRLAEGQGQAPGTRTALHPTDPEPDQRSVQPLADRLPPETTLRGLFCGGTTAHEALTLLTRAGLTVSSNLKAPSPASQDAAGSGGGSLLLDLGADEFTQGRPHPMIEPGLRNERLAVEITQPRVGLLLFDLILGFGSHADPAGVLAEGAKAARAAARRDGREIVAIASITGTDDDPQDLRLQRRKLEEAGIVVTKDNRSAAQLAAAVMRRNR